MCQYYFGVYNLQQWNKRYDETVDRHGLIKRMHYQLCRIGILAYRKTSKPGHYDKLNVTFASHIAVTVRMQRIN